MPAGATADDAFVGTLTADVATAGADVTEVTLGAEVAAEADVPVAIVTKTPPGRDADAVPAEAAEVATDEAPPVGCAAAEPEPPVALAHVPVGAAVAVEVEPPSKSTESPGLGKTRSKDSAVPQPFPMLATNISGRAL